MLTASKRPETPAGVGMAIVHHAPSDYTGAPSDAANPSRLEVRPTTNGHLGAIGAVGAPGPAAARLTRAGIVATLNVVATYIGGLSAAQLDGMYASPVGLSITVSRDLVSCPVAAGSAATLAASLATVLSTGGTTVAT